MTDGITKEIMRQVFDAAFALVEQAEGDVGLARLLWNDAFDAAERIDHTQSLSHPDDWDPWERAIMEQTVRFDKAMEARETFKIVVTDPDEGST